MGETRGHSEPCRRRIEEALGGTEWGKRLLEQADYRITRRLADEVEKADTQARRSSDPQPVVEVTGGEEEKRLQDDDAAAQEDVMDVGWQEEALFNENHFGDGGYEDVPVDEGMPDGGADTEPFRNDT